MYDTWYVSCEHVVRIQYVREYKDRLGINMNTKPIIRSRDKWTKWCMIKKSQLRKYGDIDIVVAQADLVQQHHHDRPQSDHTAVGKIAASYLLCTRYALQKHSAVPGTTAAASCCSGIRKKSKLRMNTKLVRGYRAFHCTLRPASASS